MGVIAFAWKGMTLFHLDPALLTIRQPARWVIVGSRKWLLLLSLFPVFATAQTPPQPERVIDFESSSQLAGSYLDRRYAAVTETAPLDGKASLRVDTSSSQSTWNACFKTAPGLFQGGKDYIVEFRCKVLSIGDDSFVDILMRPFDA